MARVVLGCVQLSTDKVLEAEAYELVSHFPYVKIVFSKILLEDGLVTPESFLKSAQRISTAALCLGTTSSPTIVGLACTSMSFTLGRNRVDRELKAGCIHTATTDMARGQIAALHALNAKSICLLTPYIDSLLLKNVSCIEDAGIRVLRRRTLNILTDDETSRISKEEIMKMVQEIDCVEAEAIVVGCSAFRVCDKGFIDSLERMVQKPVVTSTQAFLWIMLREGGVAEHISGYGTLFSNC